MPEAKVRYEDGAAYEQGMGRWSRLVGEVFLDWLAPPAGLRWIDVGCGSGAFTELLVERCAPAEVHGVDPSDAQLAFARRRPGARGATFWLGDAMALPFPDNRFDAAVMSLAIAFVPEPAKGVAEMARVVGPGGTVATYMWDMLRDGSPFHPIQAELRALGISPLLAPSASASRMDALRALWMGAGLESIAVREIVVERSFTDFEEFWVMGTATGSVRQTLAALARDDIDRVREGVRTRMASDAQGRITYSGRANAIQGRVPG